MQPRSALMIFMVAAALVLPACTAQLVDVPQVQTAQPAEMDTKGGYAALKVEAVKVKIAKEEVIGSLADNPLCVPTAQLFWGTGEQVFFSEGGPGRGGARGTAPGQDTPGGRPGRDLQHRRQG